MVSTPSLLSPTCHCILTVKSSGNRIKQIAYLVRHVDIDSSVEKTLQPLHLDTMRPHACCQERSISILEEDSDKQEGVK